MSAKPLRAIWEEMSPIQRQAAEWAGGTLLVLAGPGSGKTMVLTSRIARILDASKGKNFRILGLTFTNMAADEMRRRVLDVAAGQEGRLFLGTFHSFCADILRQHGIHLGIDQSFHIYSEPADLQAILNEAVDRVKVRYQVVSDLDKRTLPVIQRLKARLVLPGVELTMFRDARFAERMSFVYPAYEEELRRHNALDFNSLILETYRLFSQFPSLAKRYRTVYTHVCVDEFQDTNEAQYRLVRALAGPEPENLLAVADDDQIIYQWNGASHQRINQFLSDFGADVIQLPMNYRCPAAVVTIANNLIKQNFLRAPGKSPAESFKRNGSDEAVRVLDSFPDFESEAAGVASDISRLYGTNLCSVVIIGRSRKLIERAAQALQSAELPFALSHRKPEFESTPFVWLHAILRLAGGLSDRRIIEAACGAFYQLTSVKVEPDRVVELAQTNSLGFLQNWVDLVLESSAATEVQNVAAEISGQLIHTRDFITFSRFAVDWFSRLSANQVGHLEDPTVETFSGFEDELAVWNSLVGEVVGALGQAVTLEAFLQELQMHTKEQPPPRNSVTLMTIHEAKGKEFDHVYLIGMVDDVIPSFQSKQKGDRSPEMEEERRNCYVAITRSMSTLTLSYAQSYNGWPKEPSRFLSEMGLPLPQ
jgi:DNA helicase-2/ATP-dependent DNA helicase PcrA